MNTHDDDERLPGEDELAALYRRLPDKLPSAELDAAVLRAAAAAIRPVQPRRPRWLVAIGSAATLVLAAGLAWRMRELPSANQPPALAVSPVVSPVATAATTAVAQAPQAAPAPPAAPSAESMPAKAAIQESKSLPAPAQVSPRVDDAAVSARRSRHTEVMMAAKKPPAERLAPLELNASAAPGGGLSAQAQVLQESAPLSQDKAGASTDRMAARAAPFANQRSVSAPIQPAPPTESSRAAAPMPAPVAEATEQTMAPLERQAPMASAPPPAPMPAPAFAAPPAPPAPPAAIAGYTADPTAHRAGDTPEQELTRIRLLFSLERRDEGRQRLISFHQQHPDYLLPADLRSQLPSP